MYQTKKGKKWKVNTYNLDRKDNSKPYEMSNLVVCCGRCNMAKNRLFTYEEWKEIGEVIRRWNKPAPKDWLDELIESAEEVKK